MRFSWTIAKSSYVGSNILGREMSNDGEWALYVFVGAARTLRIDPAGVQL